MMRMRETFYYACEQGWTMIFKAVGGVSSPKVGNLWNSHLTLSENVNAALDITTTHPGHYKNRISLNWTPFNPQEVNLSLAYQIELSRFAQHLPVSFVSLSLNKRV